MAHICPTITCEKKNEFNSQLFQINKLTNRIHIDLSDKTLAPRQLLNIGQMRWPKKVKADLHIMSKQPMADVALSTHLSPHLVIIHAEADADFISIGDRLHQNGIKFGLALLQPTSPAVIEPIAHILDHVLIFSGNLGYQGGSAADLGLLTKVAWIKQINPKLEIGWDGGINDLNIGAIANSGVDVLNVGGYIHHARSPKKAYAKLKMYI